MTDEEKLEPSPPLLEGEISGTGWEVKMTRQDETHVWFRVYCKDKERDWFKIDIKCPKKKFKKVGL
jgi:transglutaminase-like putative cysteine protease